MNNTLKYCIIFSAGGIIGGAIGFLASRKYFSNLAQQEIDSVKEVWKKRCEEQEQQIQIEIEKKEEVKEENKLYRQVMNDAGYTMYSNFSHENETDESYGEKDSPPEDLPDTPIDEHNARKNKPPYLITDEEFHTECQHYEKHELRYYAEDTTFCDEADDILDDPRMLLGQSSIDSMYKAKKLHGQDMTYVRNESISADFEIQWMEGSYKEQVLGDYSE